jgi:D-glycero-D-manno-heptose 1,7-bisphosphate phosphatase
MSRHTKALFLDRDGTIIEHIPYLHDPAEVRLLPGAQAALCEAMGAGFRLFLFTNQSGVGRGMFDMEAVEACNRRMLELLNLPEPGFTRICVAPEAPEAETVYRKPSPRFIEEMIEAYDLDRSACWMIGDSECDRLAAKNAGINWVRVDPGMSLPEAVGSILKADRKA